MLTVGRLAKRFGLSRSTLLYYDRIGLLRPTGHMKGEYRHYSQADQERLERIVTYRRAGLSLDGIARVLDAPDSGLTLALEERLEALSGEIRSLQEQQRFILRLLGSADLPPDGVLDKATWTGLLEKAGFSEQDMREWHARFEARSPEDHLRFLQLLCIPKDEIDMIRSWASNPLKMEKVRQVSTMHMEMLFKFFEGFKHKGPGGKAETLAALDMAKQAAPRTPTRILDLGCGSGPHTLVLAEHLPSADILAVDVSQTYLDELDAAASALGEGAGLASRITTHKADMNKLDRDPVVMEAPFDLIWTEGSLFVMGLDKALTTLGGLLVPGGVLACTDAIWTQDPHDPKGGAPREVADFADQYFPGMFEAEGWLALARERGWEPVGSFPMAKERWLEFYAQYDERLPVFLHQVEEEHPGDQERLDAAKGLAAELVRERDLFRKHPDWYTYLFAVLRRK